MKIRDVVRFVFGNLVWTFAEGTAFEQTRVTLPGGRFVAFENAPHRLRVLFKDARPTINTPHEHQWSLWIGRSDVPAGLSSREVIAKADIGRLRIVAAKHGQFCETTGTTASTVS